MVCNSNVAEPYSKSYVSVTMSPSLTLFSCTYNTTTKLWAKDENMYPLESIPHQTSGNKSSHPQHLKTVCSSANKGDISLKFTPSIGKIRILLL